MQATRNLVDGVHGQYAWQILATTRPLFVHIEDQHIPLEDWMKTRADFDAETLESVFDPNNELGGENIDYLTQTETLTVKGDTDDYWNVDQTEQGDIVAVHPDADWDDEKGWHLA